MTSIMLNKRDRKIYSAIRKLDGKKVIIVVSKDVDYHFNIEGVPREIRILMSLKGKKQFVQLLGWKPLERQLYTFVLEHVHNIDPVAATQGNLGLIAELFKSTLVAVKEMQKTIAHRDIAIDNMLWDPVKKEMVIIDFNLACFKRERGYRTDLGRENYDAPEKKEVLENVRKDKKLKYKNKKTYNERAEVYSLGIILWMLYKQEKHSPNAKKIKNWLRKSRHRGVRSLEIENLIISMLCGNPNKRITIDKALEHKFITSTPMDEESEEIKKIIARVTEQKYDYSDHSSDHSDFECSDGDDDDDDDDEVTKKENGDKKFPLPLKEYLSKQLDECEDKLRLHQKRLKEFDA